MNIVRRLILILVIVPVLCFEAHAATIYMGPTETYTTLQAAFAAMSSGDTLIIRNGTYTYSSGANQISWSSGHYPPFGSAGNYTKIQAETDGGVLFDGENSNWMFDTEGWGSVHNCYWQFEGIVWGRSSQSVVFTYNAAYIKFLRCGAYDAADGINQVWRIANNCSYILLEGCYGYGNGRYMFIAYRASNIIFRNCVGRSDRINAGNEPAAVFTCYTSSHVLFQNCIAIDSDNTDYYTNVGEWCGPWNIPTTSGAVDDVQFVNCIALKVALGGISVSQNYDATNINFINCVLWDISYKTGISGLHMNSIRADSHQFYNGTYGVSATNNNSWWYDDAGTSAILNSIFYGITGASAFFGGTVTHDYSCFNSITTPPTLSAHDVNINPIYNASTNPTGGLKYLPRIESGSNMSGQGQSGADIGANLTYLHGTSGSLWGDNGYNTVTATVMWPFPNESVIKTKLAAYSGGGVTGARGFATGTSIDGSAQTLTKYIWEYLGNQIPADIYGDTTAPTLSGVSGAGFSVR